MEVGDEVEEEGEGGKPRKSAPLVTENQTNLSREKDIFHDRRKGMRRKMKILKLEPTAALQCKGFDVFFSTSEPCDPKSHLPWDRVGVCVTDWPCDYGKPWPGASVPSSVLGCRLRTCPGSVSHGDAKRQCLWLGLKSPGKT